MIWTTEKPVLVRECIVIGMSDRAGVKITFAFDFYLTENDEWESIDAHGYYIGLDSLDYDYYMVINYPEQEAGK